MNYTFPLLPTLDSYSGWTTECMEIKMTSALLLAILTITAFETSCALMPATSENGSGVDPAEVITVRYCIIDNSTI